ncbi:hypothetical protein KRMM14A1259_68150 [Krasilnikovia sp. MM14-A1259]
MNKAFGTRRNAKDAVSALRTGGKLPAGWTTLRLSGERTVIGACLERGTARALSAVSSISCRAGSRGCG